MPKMGIGRVAYDVQGVFKAASLRLHLRFCAVAVFGIDFQGLCPDHNPPAKWFGDNHAVPSRRPPEPVHSPCNWDNWFLGKAGEGNWPHCCGAGRAAWAIRGDGRNPSQIENAFQTPQTRDRVTIAASPHRSHTQMVNGMR